MPAPSYSDLESSVQDGNVGFLIKLSHQGRAILLTDTPYWSSISDADSLLVTDAELGIPVLDTMLLTEFLAQFELTADYLQDHGSILSLESFLDHILLDTDRYVSFVPYPVTTGAFSSANNDGATNEVTLNIPIRSPLANYYMASFHKGPTQLRVWRFHRNNPSDLRLYWSGRLYGSAVQDTGNVLTLQFYDWRAQLDVASVSGIYSKLCRHALYTAPCGVDPATHREGATITGYTGSTITVDYDSAMPANHYYTHGVLEFSPYLKLGILRQVGTSITLNGKLPLTESHLPKAVTLLPGCDLSTSSCLNKFNNLINHGGFPFIPKKPPFGGLNIYLAGV